MSDQTQQRETGQTQQHGPAAPDVPAVNDGPAAPGVPADPPRKDRRTLRAVLRWTAAVVVFAAVGTGTAFGVGAVDRTGLPGLATASDGRWEYPTLTKAPLPDGSPGPFAESNGAEAHYADLRALVLPAPKGAKEDRTLRGTDGWLATDTFLAEYADKPTRTVLRLALADRGLRHIAARGWTTGDGTRTRIYLLQFGTSSVVDELFTEHVAPVNLPGYRLRDTDVALFDPGFAETASVGQVARSAYDEAEPYGTTHVRQAYLSAGDVLALVVQSRKGKAAAVPFQQTVVLQSQLLG